MSFVGSLSNIFGRSQLLFASVSFFTIGTIVCCTAHSIGAMLAGRSIQGVGGGGVIVLAQIIFTDIVPLRYRPKYLGIIQGAWALGTCLGPVLGGALAKPNLWRWVFYILLPFCGISLFLIPLTVRLDGRKASLQNMLTRVDWIGGGLFVSSTASFLIGLSWGGNQYSWSSASTLVPLILGAVGMVATIVWESYCPFEPFLPPSIFYNASAIILYGGAFFQGFLVGGDPGLSCIRWSDFTNGLLQLYGQLYYLAFFFASVQLKSPLDTAVVLIPPLLTLIPSAIVVGAVITRTTRYRWAMWSGFVILSLSAGLAIIFDDQTKASTWAPVCVLIGIGHGLALNALLVASQSTAKPGHEAFAAATYVFMRSLGMACGVGIGGTIFQNIMVVKLRDLDLPTSIALESEAYISVLHHLGDTPERAAIISAYRFGFRGLFGCFCGFAGLALFATLFVKHYEINKELVSEHKLRYSQRFDQTTQKEKESTGTHPALGSPDTTPSQSLQSNC